MICQRWRWQGQDVGSSADPRVLDEQLVEVLERAAEVDVGAVAVLDRLAEEVDYGLLNRLIKICEVLLGVNAASLSRDGLVVIRELELASPFSERKSVRSVGGHGPEELEGTHRALVYLVVAGARAIEILSILVWLGDLLGVVGYHTRLLLISRSGINPSIVYLALDLGGITFATFIFQL